MTDSLMHISLEFTSSLHFLLSVFFSKVITKDLSLTSTNHIDAQTQQSETSSHLVEMIQQLTTNHTTISLRNQWLNWNFKIFDSNGPSEGKIYPAMEFLGSTFSTLRHFIQYRPMPGKYNGKIPTTFQYYQKEINGESTSDRLRRETSFYNFSCTHIATHKRLIPFVFQPTSREYHRFLILKLYNHCLKKKQKRQSLILSLRNPSVTAQRVQESCMKRVCVV